MGPATTEQRVYWHRDLPPARAEVVGEDSLEATSTRVAGSLRDRDLLWDRCLADLKQRTEDRLDQEITRRGACYAHVLSEVTDTRRDDAKGEAWLHARITYLLLR